jgi:4a-hydroxytetrahydrobiopterin dehydratase
MSQFETMTCVACRAGAPPATEEEILGFLSGHPNWARIEVDGVSRIRRAFRFADFAAALEFTNQVGALAEAQDHHPELITEWGRVTVSWWTHKIRGLHVNDLIMGARTDEVFRSAAGDT